MDGLRLPRLHGWLPPGDPAIETRLKDSGIEIDRVVENNGAKQYRLSVPPGNVTFDETVIRQHVTGAKNLFDTVSSGH